MNISQSNTASRAREYSTSLCVESGDIFAFIGHNGAGKTTTLRSVAGIHGADEGEIFIDGISMRQSPLEAKARIAYIPDNPDLFEYLTGMVYMEKQL